MENKLFGNDLIRQTHRFRRNQYEALRLLSRLNNLPTNVLVRYAVDELIKSQLELEQPTPKKRTSG